MRCGGYCPAPLRCGGSVPRIKTVLGGLLAARGTAYDISSTTEVWAEDMAVARALAMIWDVNELLGNQIIPLKLSVLLERWEKILGLPIDPSLTLAERRSRVHSLVSRTGTTPTLSELTDRITALISPVTFTISHNAPGDAAATSSWRGGWYVQATGTTPPVVTLAGESHGDLNIQIDIIAGGPRGTATFQYSFDGGATIALPPQATAASMSLLGTGLTITFAVGTYNADNFYTCHSWIDGFSSNVARITIAASKPSWMSEGMYSDKVKGVKPLLDAYLPAWCGYQFVRDGSVPGHFILDEPNLDSSRLG